MSVAIIPARGGSKRIPLKNIKEFCGRPMIAWSIEAALSSGCFERVIVSTDDLVIADIAKQCGAEVPFLRPEELANDHAGTIPVIAHALRELQATGSRIEYACCIYATAPFLEASTIAAALDVLKGADVDYAFAVTTYPFPIQRAVRVTKAGRVEMFEPESFHKRSQDLPEAWHDAGQFYWGRTAAWLEEKVLFSSRSAAVPLARYKVQDIDTPDDWTRAELMFRALRKLE